MSSKSAEPARSGKSTWSLAQRIARHFFVSTSVILAAAAGFLYLTLHRTLDDTDRAHVISKAKVLQYLVREHADNPAVIASEVEHEAAFSQPFKFYLRILDEQGKTVMETTGMAELLPPSVFPAPTPSAAIINTEHPAATTVETANYLLVAVRDSVASGATRTYVYQVALDVSAQEILLSDFRLRLLMALLGGITMAAIASVLITERGLKPLAEIVTATQRVTVNRLERYHLSTQTWPKELTSLAASFDAMLERLDQSFKRLTQFSADMAHALRNPINNLRGEAEVALQRCRSPQEYQQVLASSLEELDRLSRMIDSLLFIARADDPGAALKRTQFLVRQEMDAVKEFYEALASDSRVQVHCEGDATITGDPMLVRRAISNLLSNALKHTPEQGRVDLVARTTDDGGAEIMVRDNGKGIPADALPLVFDRFFQVDQSRDLTAKGAGLGLAIVKSIMTLHGGTASVESQLDSGTTITLRFPRSLEQV
jgi:two-component system, OmpR family, heavy metal sensor histidine kinase CusS